MAVSTYAMGKKVFTAQLIDNNACGPPKFLPILEVAYKEDPAEALSSIPMNVLMVNDVCSCYMCKIGEIGDFEIRQAYEKLYDNGVLKDEYKIVKTKGLTDALDILNILKTKWIRVILS